MKEKLYTLGSTLVILYLVTLVVHYWVLSRSIETSTLGIVISVLLLFVEYHVVITYVHGQQYQGKH